MVRPTLLAFVVIVAASGACGGRPADAPLENSCRVMLGPRASTGTTTTASVAATPPAFTAPASTLVVSAEIPLSHVKDGLDAKVARRIAEERDHDLGLAGRLEYTVDRGPFAVRVDGDALVVEAPIDAHARACAKGSCYAGCDPQARAVARVPLRLGPDYKFRPSSVHVDITRGCEVRALGGLVRIDLTSILQQRLAQETPKIAGEIDRQLPDLRPEAARIWGELEKPRPLPFGACAILLPEQITEGPPSGGADVARLRFAVIARPEVRLRCGAAPRVLPLPPLREDDAMPAQGDVHLAIVLPPEAPSIALGGAPDVVDLGRGRARFASASGVASALVVELTGEACGSVGVHALGAAWTADGHAVHLTGVAPLAGDATRVSDAGLDGSALTSAIERAPIVVPLAADSLKSTLPDLVGAVSDERVLLSAVVSDAQPEVAALRGDEIVALVRIRGALTLRAK